jgi:hypothetical protein
MTVCSNVYRLGTGERTDSEKGYIETLETFYANSTLSNVERLMNFAKYVPRQDIAKFVAKYEMFKRVLNVPGAVVECGVAFGGGLMTFAQLSAVLEPVNYQRRIIGFDTFEGFPSLSAKDREGTSPQAKVGGMSAPIYQELLDCIELYDRNRFLSHIQKVELVKGDVTVTIPQYLQKNPHLIISLLYLDLDLYEPTKVAVQYFLPRMPKGSLIAFDELNHPDWPGETLAVVEELGIGNLHLERFAFDTTRSFAILEAR